MPSSIASFARNGGASAVAVAARSDPIASAVRSLYGAASSASVRSRRAVRRHDQSETRTGRSIDRWLPACQTLTALLRGLLRADQVDARLAGKVPHLPWPMARA